MPIILPPLSGVTALDSYAELKDAVCGPTGFMHRTDIEARFDTFLLLAEERINRTLRCSEMEVSLAPTVIASNAIAIPTGTVAVKSLWLSGYESSPLKVMPYDRLKRQGTEGVAAHYSWQGLSFHFDGTGTVTGVLYERVPALTAAANTNWLLAAHPSAYLWGVITEACAYVMDDERAARADARFKQALGDINKAGQRDVYSGPLTVRAG